MPLYRGTSYKMHTASGKVFSNVYTIEESGALEALDVLNAIAVRENAVTYSTIESTKLHIVNLSDSHDTRTAPGYGPGVLDPTGLGGPLPLFCTVRVLFTNDSGKPEQKYLRLGANEANLTLGAWDGEFVAQVQSGYATPLVAQTQYVGPNGEAHTNSEVIRAVQNRQLGWHRRFRPGYHRGWVAG